MTQFVTDVVINAQGRWPELLSAIGISTPSHGKHGPCPCCGGRDRFRLDDKQGRGTWICNHCGYGDGLDLVAKVTGSSLKSAAEMIASQLGLPVGGLSPTERGRLRLQQQARVEERQRQEQQQHQKAADEAARLMRDCEITQSPYLKAKGLGSYPCTISRSLKHAGGKTFPPGSTVVPLTIENGSLVNVQLIRKDGTKRYLPGGQTQGAFHRIDGSEFITIAEGFATGLSVHQATGATTYCAMSCGNLQAVAQMVRRLRPAAQILICGDNDLHTSGNPGKTKAEQAAACIDASSVMPPVAGDWNDFFQTFGPEETNAHILRNARSDGRQ